MSASLAFLDVLRQICAFCTAKLFYFFEKKSFCVRRIFTQKSVIEFIPINSLFIYLFIYPPARPCGYSYILANFAKNGRHTFRKCVLKRLDPCIRVKSNRAEKVAGT